MGAERDITTCVAVRAEPGDVQTFVDAHIRGLPGCVHVLWGRELNLDSDGRQIVTGGPLRKAAHAVQTLTAFNIENRLVVRGRAAFLRRRGVDVVLAEFGQACARMHSACRRAGVPLVAYFHGYDAYRQDVLAVYLDHYRVVFDRASAIVAVSRHMADHLAGLGAPEEKLHVSSSGVDTSLFGPTDPAGNPALFVAVGRFVEKKAPYLTLAAFRHVLDAWPEARLAMIGDGPLLPMCRDLAGALELAASVDFPGRLPQEEVARAMQGARAFVQHSVTASTGDAEGTPVAILEAGASGLPVVATRHTGIAESVVEDETGFLVDERDVGGMAEHMIRLAREPELAAEIGAAARERVVAEYSMERRNRVLHDILAEAAASG